MTEILVRKSLEEGLRLDGRPLSTPVATAGRKPVISFDKHGTVEVKYGQTIALCVVTGEVVVPPKDRQNEGKIGFHVEYGPLASPDFQVGKQSLDSISAANMIERILKGSRAIDTEALCIVGGQKVWSIRVDIRALNDDGNLLDACAVAALCGLLHFRKEAVITTGKDTEVVAQEEREPVPLSVHHMPVPVSFALYQGDPVRCVLDPTHEEEKYTEGLLCVCVNQHGDLCGLHKPGGLPLTLDVIQQCTQVAVERAKLVTVAVQKALAKDAEVKKAAKRDVHNKYKASDLLSVEGAALGAAAGGIVAPPPGMDGGVTAATGSKSGSMNLGFGGAGSLDLLDDDDEKETFSPAARVATHTAGAASVIQGNPFLAQNGGSAKGMDISPKKVTSNGSFARGNSAASIPSISGATKPKRALAAPSLATAADDDDDLMSAVKVKKAKKAKKSK